MVRERQARRCRKVKRDGNKCGSYAVNGRDLCRAHLAPSGRAVQIVQEKREEMQAQYLAERLISAPTADEHQALRTRVIMSGITRLELLIRLYYPAAKEKDEHAAHMVAGYQRELTSLLKIAPAATEEDRTTGAVAEVLQEIAGLIDGTANVPVQPLRIAEAPRESAS